MRFEKSVFLMLVLVLVGCSAICDSLCKQCKDQPPPPPGQQVTIEAIENALTAKVDSHLIAGKIREKGVAFELNDETRRRLKKAKADKIIYDAISEVNMKKSGGKPDKWF